MCYLIPSPSPALISEHVIAQGTDRKERLQNSKSSYLLFAFPGKVLEVCQSYGALLGSVQERERLTDDGDSRGANPKWLPSCLAFPPLMAPLIVFCLHTSIFIILLLFM